MALKKKKAKPNVQVQKRIFKELLHIEESTSNLANALNETISDVSLWSYGKKLVSIRATIKIALNYKVKPYLLRPELFPVDTNIIWEKTDNE